MSSSEKSLYIKGSKIWLPHPETVWQAAVILKDYTDGDTNLSVQCDDGKKLELPINSESLPPLHNPAILVGQHDLTSLSYLHEPAVLHNLEVRFKERQVIYTYCGIILVAINPYAELPLYGSDMIKAYRGHSIGELEPHIFAVAEEAYAKLERDNCSLSIIISGESGAGKTVSAKYAMRYFAVVGGSEGETQIEKKVLASSPIMESFGNAKTTRNDNSSRFGKYTKLLFHQNFGNMHLTGATMQTYLLEKSRVVYQSLDERNYHIFYQICSARNDLSSDLHLGDFSKFRFLNMGSLKDQDSRNEYDKSNFNETLIALKTLDFSSQEINEIMRVLAGILHLGNIKFQNKLINNTLEIDQECCDIPNEDVHLKLVCDILKLDKETFQKWLTTRQIESVNELVLIPNNIPAAETARDALAKHIYAKLFEFIVKVINRNLNVGNKKEENFIGVLDIYGFETFKVNSFEQFCINYANERLQQQFNQHVFKLEQDVYVKEGIEWTKIDFYDNQPCIDLIEAKLGILDLLDEECRVPNGSDEGWAQKLVMKCAKYKHFEKSRFGTASFLVKHFSDTVQYTATGFLDKNRDAVSKELVDVVRHSKLNLCKHLMELEENDVLGNAQSKPLVVQESIKPRQSFRQSAKHRRTVGNQFRDSLGLLISTLDSTTPHYVRCIKPNDTKSSFKWEVSKIVQQLRACGVLETVRISASGYPSRVVYDEFYKRYEILCKSTELPKDNVHDGCKAIVRKWIDDDDKYRFGNTMIFFRYGQIAFFEQKRLTLRKQYIIIAQSAVRRFICRRRFLRLRRIALGIQTYSRGYLARKKAQSIRENRAATIIQKHVRGWLCRRKYVKLKNSAHGIQRFARGMLARFRYKNLLDNYRATQIQRYCRGYLARKRFNEKIKKIIICQSAVRRYLARKQFKRLKAEARSMNHLQMRYKGLENKIISLQQRIDELNVENKQLKLQTNEIPILKENLEQSKKTKAQVMSLQLALAEHEASIANLEKQIEMEKDEKMLVLEERDKQIQEYEEKYTLWRIENEELKKKLDEIVTEIAKSDEEKQNSMKREYRHSEGDFNDDEIYSAYQRIIKERDVLESEVTFLKRIYGKSNNEDEDGGYLSANNTLRQQDLNKSLREDEADILSKAGQIGLILKLRNVMEEEKIKNNKLSDQLEKLMERNKPTVDSLRVQELEVENDRLRHDYALLLKSIKNGTEIEEIKLQHSALDEELVRRRDECLSLKAILQDNNQSLKELSLTTSSSRLEGSVQDRTELAEAYDAQRLVNRQLESELTAITEEYKVRLVDLMGEIEMLRTEKCKLEDILQSSLLKDEAGNIEIDCTVEQLKQNTIYLKHELQKTLNEFVEMQKQINEYKDRVERMKGINNKLTLKLHEHGITPLTEAYNSPLGAMVKKKKSNKMQGIFKFKKEDLKKIYQELFTDFSPKKAITMLPALPSYVVFMMIRYTDLINKDDQVKDLLTLFVCNVNVYHRKPYPTETRVMWLVNSLTLFNLLKQYGGCDDFNSLNTDIQNQHLLKNFDLTEYRQVIHIIIANLHTVLVKQIQGLIKPYIVPAVLEHDEMSKTKKSSQKNAEHDAEPKSLVLQLEHYYKQFTYFGLDRCFSEQIFKQFFYFICAVSMNSLMLRPDICVWKTGMQIRYNISVLDEWVRQKKMSKEILEPITPLHQVSFILQSRKSEDDVENINEVSNALSAAQVLKIIKSYHSDDCEDAISPAFVEKLTARLNDRKGNQANEAFTMDEDYIHSLKVVFKHSDIKLEDIDLPEPLNLKNLLVKI